jgi:hypothetical protein
MKPKIIQIKCEKDLANYPKSDWIKENIIERELKFTSDFIWYFTTLLS